MTTTRRIIRAFDEARRTNAQMILDLVELGFIDADMRTLDPTYGYGKWWTEFQPYDFTGTDLNPAKSPWGGGYDFRNLPFDDGEFDLVAFDPPYKLNGTSSQGGPADSDESYGVDGEYVPWQKRHETIRDGITEMSRVLAIGGIGIVKCQDQQCSGALREQVREFTTHAETVGLKLVDRLHVFGEREQPPGRGQKHSRNNYSTALVFRRKRVARRKLAVAA